MRKVRDCVCAAGYSRLNEKRHITLTVCKLNGEELSVDCPVEGLVADVKDQLGKNYGILENTQILVLEGAVLKDHLSLCGCRLEQGDNTQLQLVIASEPTYAEARINVFEPSCFENIPPEFTEHITVEEWRSFCDPPNPLEPNPKTIKIGLQ
eukprot:1007802-Amphidinium_carterae.1